jgi:hypothetical protein
MKIDPDKVPSTVEEAVESIVASLDAQDRVFIKSEHGSSSIHHGIGTHIRNEWSLWNPDSPIKRDAVIKYGIAHADDISGLIWAWVWAKVRGEDFDPVEHCEFYHKHWKDQGTNSLEAGGWKEP